MTLHFEPPSVVHMHKRVSAVRFIAQAACVLFASASVATLGGFACLSCSTPFPR